MRLDFKTPLRPEIIPTPPGIYDDEWGVLVLPWSWFLPPRQNQTCNYCMAVFKHFLLLKSSFASTASEAPASETSSSMS